MSAHLNLYMEDDIKAALVGILYDYEEDEYLGVFFIAPDTFERYNFDSGDLIADLYDLHKDLVSNVWTYSPHETVMKYVNKFDWPHYALPMKPDYFERRKDSKSQDSDDNV